MITIDDYMTHLRNKGNTVGEIRKTEADMITNATFRGDPACRRVYILDPIRGWHWTEAKLHKHLNQSIASDEVDSYLQFRPKEHYPIGTYVFIPEDESYDMHLNEERPFNGDLSHLWLICERSDSRQTVQYLVLQINWNFKWVVGYGDQKKVLNCWGVVRNANSYTSGVWNDFRVTALDSITSAFLPNTYYVY